MDVILWLWFICSLRKKSEVKKRNEKQRGHMVCVPNGIHYWVLKTHPLHKSRVITHYSPTPLIFILPFYPYNHLPSFNFFITPWHAWVPTISNNLHWDFLWQGHRVSLSLLCSQTLKYYTFFSDIYPYDFLFFLYIIGVILIANYINDQILKILYDCVIFVNFVPKYVY